MTNADDQSVILSKYEASQLKIVKESERSTTVEQVKSLVKTLTTADLWNTLHVIDKTYDKIKEPKSESEKLFIAKRILTDYDYADVMELLAEKDWLRF